jgi:hypothetical protein
LEGDESVGVEGKSEGGKKCGQNYNKGEREREGGGGERRRERGREGERGTCKSVHENEKRQTDCDWARPVYIYIYII